MDLDDSFTERLLQRSELRKQFKLSKENETPELLIKKRPTLIEEKQITNQDFKDSVGYSPKRPYDDLEDSPKRQCLEQCKGSPSRHWPPQKHETVLQEKENIPSKGSSKESFVPFKSSLNVRGLAALRKTHDNGSSVINSKLTSEADSNCRTNDSSELCKGRKTRLANLAADINQWEDDLHHSKTSINNANSTNFKSSKEICNSVEVLKSSSHISYTGEPLKIQSNSVKNNSKFFDEIACSAINDVKRLSPLKGNNVGNEYNTNKTRVSDQAIKVALETKFKISPTKSLRATDGDSVFTKNNIQFHETGSPCDIKKSKLQKIVGDGASEKLNTSFDPTHLPISARKALFESGLQDAKRLKQCTIESKLSVAERTALFENAVQKSSTSKPISSYKSKIVTPPQSPIKASKIDNINVQSSPLTPEKPNFQSKATLQFTFSPVKEIVVGTGAVEKMQLTQTNNKADTEERLEKQDETCVKGNDALVSYWEKLSAPAKSTNSNSEDEMFDKPEEVGSEMYNSEDNLEGYESETESRYERMSESESRCDNISESESRCGNVSESRCDNLSESESRFGKVSKSESGFDKVSESESRYDKESESRYDEESESRYDEESESRYDEESESKCEEESEFNYNSEITEEFSECDTDARESDHEYESPTVENVFKSPKGVPLSKISGSKISDSHLTDTADALKKNCSSWKEENFIEDSCDATSLSEESSYAESTVSADIRSTETCQSHYTGSTSSVGSSFDPESSKESEENFAKTISCGSSDAPLLYTVSFYRKQRQDTKTPPLKSTAQVEQTSMPSPINQTSAIQEQIKFYQEEINKQQTIIGQTSQALNLCIATEEFYGSSEQVEGERLLLIATQKRQALLNEIQRLKTHGAEGESVPDGTGTLTISDLELPLKKEFLAAQLEGKINDAVHWFLCLIRYGPQVIVTQMVSTDNKVTNGALSFTNHIKLQNLPPDFSIIFEIYALQTKKEHLPHDKKYHIKRDKNTLRLASKGKKTDNKLSLPSITSPGGPNAVRSPSFGVIGFTRFTIHNCNKKCFTLDKIPFTSPLEGILRVKLQLHAEHKVMEKGFLTMFEDVSGFGAWHRRWCALNAQYLTYWKYPEDEYKKAPIGSIDLKQCVTAQVKPVSREVCARPQTFQLVIVRPQSKEDKNTLISHCSNTMTTIKHLLSADTKEERILWCSKLSEALITVRKWDPQALRPSEANQDVA